jgi:hypothetical protein
MPDFSKAKEIAVASFRYQPGAFYGNAGGRALGVGLMYDSVIYPLLNEEESVYDTVEGPVYVLTHECDVDAENDRAFNEYVLICPITPFDVWASEFAETRSEGALFGIVPDLASDKIYRAFYLPPFRQRFPYGCVLYLNQICSTHRSCFDSPRAHPLCALSTYAQGILDRKMQNHLFRPKADQLPRLT